MTITIAHLYYDLLNLYGESGNVRILKKVLEQQGIKVIVKFLTVDDELDFNNYDFVYMGMGIEDNLLLVNDHLIKYKDDIKKYIDSNNYFVCTGNSYELFGKQIEVNNKNIKTLGIFNYKSKALKTRKIEEINSKCKLIKKDIIGFMNTGSYNDNKKNNFLSNEGILYNNFIGTYTVGPLLIRNPDLLQLIVKNLIKTKDKKHKLKKIDLEFLETAYNDCVERRKLLNKV